MYCSKKRKWHTGNDGNSNTAAIDIYQNNPCDDIECYEQSDVQSDVEETNAEQEQDKEQDDEEGEEDAKEHEEEEEEEDEQEEEDRTKMMTWRSKRNRMRMKKMASP